MLNRLLHKLLFGATVIMLSIGGLVGLALGHLSAWNQAAGRLERGSHLAVMDGIFHSSLTRATAEAVSFAVTGNEDYGKEASEAILYAQTAMAQLRRASGEPAERDRRPELRRLRQRQEAVLMQVRNNVTKTLRIRDGEIKGGLETLYEGETEGDAIWREVLAWHDSERRALAQEMREIESRMLRLVAATLVVGALWVLALLAYLGRAVTRPINRLAQAAERVAGGDLEQQIRVTSRDEIGALQRSFNRMVQNLRERHSAVHEQVQEMSPAADAPSVIAADAPGEAEPLPRQAQPAPTMADKRVLLLEIDAASRELTKAMLQHCGIQVTVAEDGLEARSALARQAFDLILMDCDLPAPDVAETVEQVRRSGVQQCNVPIIALTAADVPDAGDRCLAAGMTDQLTKPVSFFELHALLTRWLQPA